MSPFGVVERSTMAPGIRFACLTNGSPAVIVAGAGAFICSQKQMGIYMDHLIKSCKQVFLRHTKLQYIGTTLSLNLEKTFSETFQQFSLIIL